MFEALFQGGGVNLVDREILAAGGSVPEEKTSTSGHGANHAVTWVQ